MRLQNLFSKIEQVLDEIKYSNRDISKLEARRPNVRTHVGGKSSAMLDTDMGERLRTQSSSTNSQVATIDREGYVHGLSTGTATVTLTAADLSVSVNANIGGEVVDTSAIPTQDRTIDEIAIINPRETLEVDDEYALYAVGISNNLSPKYDLAYYNPIKWSTSDPTVAGVTFGTLMAYSPGTCTITAQDLNNNASASFTLTVIPKQEPTATDAETYTPTIDNTGETDVTAAIATALSYAASNGYKKVSFPRGEYKMSGDNRPNSDAINLPSNMIIDFNGSKIHFDPTSTAVNSGYTMFKIEGRENVWLRNANFYGENETLVTVIRKEGNRTLLISKNSKNIHVENCAFRWSPGFNVGISYAMNHRTGFPPNAKTAGSVEAGGLDDQGNDTNASGTWRTVFKSCTLNNGYWILGMFQGYQVAHMRSRLYDIFFYNSNKELIYKKRNCYVYQRYFFPTGITPSYCRLVFFQTNEPTSYDADFNGFVHICDNLNPLDIYFKNCIFERAVSTGLSPQGGEHVVVDHCTFIDNGYQDPYSHIDWEDGRQSGQGCIVKNCTFSRPGLSGYGGQIINGYCRNVTFHDNYVVGCSFRTGDESTMQRCFNNIFRGGSVTITGKLDSVFAGNTCNFTPTISDPTVENCTTHTISVDNQIT